LPDPVTGVKKTNISISKELKKETSAAKKEVKSTNSTKDEEDEPQNQPVQKEQVVLPLQDFELVMSHNKVQ
jgi:hypothetical protein